ncbi:MAG: YcnI family protein [Streptomycetales bacterium]
MSRLHTRSAVVAGAVVAALAAAAPPAAAHVTVDPAQEEPGGFTALAFRVPTEGDDASTVKLDVKFPTDHPVASVSVRPHPGWSYRVRTTTLDEPIDMHGSQVSEVVDTITWRADSPDSAIEPGEYDEFSVSLGPLPDTDRLVFKAVQTYDTGEAVRWIEVPEPGAAEPDHPAPALTLGPAASHAHSPLGEYGESHSGANSGDNAADVTAEPASAHALSQEGGEAAPSAMTYAALPLALLALLVALASVVLVLRRSNTPR